MWDFEIGVYTAHHWTWDCTTVHIFLLIKLKKKKKNPPFLMTSSHTARKIPRCAAIIKPRRHRRAPPRKVLHQAIFKSWQVCLWCIPVQKEIKPIIWGAAITPEPWNRQQCWFIFEDPNVRVPRLSESLVTIIATLRWASCGPGRTTGRPAQGCVYCNYS